MRPDDTSGLRPQTKTLHYNYPSFNLEGQSDAECRANFKVEKHHIPLVENVLQIPQYFACDQATVSEGTEGLCMFLKLTTVHTCLIYASYSSYRVKSVRFIQFAKLPSN